MAPRAIAGRPRLLFYCQHSLGLGHLVRSLALVRGMAEHFDVLLLNGGRLPAGTRVPAGVELINLPPLGHDASFQLYSHDRWVSLEQAQHRRRQAVLAALQAARPAVVVVELYPFGRKRFRFELEPLLQAAAAADWGPRVVCSLRDILVGNRRDQAGHDERAAVTANRYLDSILVHADPRFARLEESFSPVTPLRVPVLYTGFVAPEPAPGVARPRLPRVLVSAGGGMVGEPLFRIAARAAGTVAGRTGLGTTIVAGPFLPAAAWARLRRLAGRTEDLQVLRQVSDLAGEMRRSAVSVSQGGYNTTMDILRAGTPSVVVPYSTPSEDEQRRRAGRLAELGALRMIPPEDLDAATLADRVSEAAGSRPRPLGLDLDGAAAAARIVAQRAGVLLPA